MTIITNNDVHFQLQCFPRKQKSSGPVRGRYWARIPASCDLFQCLALSSPWQHPQYTLPISIPSPSFVFLDLRSKKLGDGKNSWKQKRKILFECGGSYKNGVKEKKTPNKRFRLFSSLKILEIIDKSFLEFFNAPNILTF